jgi:hypothetical protein
MRKQYGPEKAEKVFYASKNKGKISGVDEHMDSYKKIGLLIAEAMGLAKKKGLASLYPPYDKITRGDVITGRLKGKKKIQEGMQRRIRQRNAIEKRIASGKGSDEDLKRVETLGAQAEKARTRAGRMAASSVFGGSRARSADAKVRKATGEGAGDRALLNATKEERSRKAELARKREAMKKEYEERKKREQGDIQEAKKPKSSQEEAMERRRKQSEMWQRRRDRWKGHSKSLPPQPKPPQKEED